MASVRADTADVAPVPSVDFDARLMARVLAGLFASGATLALLTVLLPHSATAHEIAMLATIGNAYAAAAVLYSAAGRIPTRLLPIALAWGSVLITGAAYFSGQTPSPLVFFYLWIFLYSAYFFSRWQAILQIAIVGVAYGALLGFEGPADGAADWWLVGIGTLLVAALVIATMRQRVGLLIGRLHEAARTDPLTQLTNRRGFREQLDLEIERARRSGRPLTVAIGDLDHFKKVNDREGHDVGDIVLTRVGSVLLTGKRVIDSAARVGGEEFALILPDTEGGNAMLLIDRIREMIRIEFRSSSVPITISFGIAQYPTHGETAASLLRAVDEALYEAKQTGRNRSVLHDLDMRGNLGLTNGMKDVEGERFVGVMLSLAEAVDLRFSGSARHSETVGRYAEMMARELGFSEHQVGRIRLAGMLHDIGKAGLPDAILHKPGRLTDDEFSQVRTHPGLGAQILEHPSLEDVREWVGAHHERPDGNGYPLGLSGDQLSIESQIVAVADAYEAMTSDRNYRASIGFEAAIVELRRCAGSQFDPAVVEAFIVANGHESGRGSNRADALLAPS